MSGPTVNSAVFQERQKRFYDTVALKKADRIPIVPMVDTFPIRYYGVKMKDAINELPLLNESWMRYLNEFQPDMGDNPYGITGFFPIADALGFNILKWAGHGLDDNANYQFVEHEIMPPEDYDKFLFDPTDYMLRYVMPKTYDKLSAFSKIPNLQANFYIMKMFAWGALLDPGFAEAGQAMVEASRRAGQAFGNLIAFEKAQAAAGFPSSLGGMTSAPFDALGDFLRGMKGVLKDLRRCPDKIEAACEKLLPPMIEHGVGICKMSRCPICFIPLHKHVDSLMSQQQFLRFYWPTLKALILAIIAEGLTPYVLVEGVADQRLPVMISEVPEGKVIYHLEGSDIFKAKELARGKVCLRGNIPASIMTTGDPSDVRNYCKKLIDVVGKDGGFIMDVAACLTDAKPENVKMMFDFTREYGVY